MHRIASHSVIFYLALFFGTHLVADPYAYETANPTLYTCKDGIVVYTDFDGSRVRILPDGTKMISYSEGNLQIDPDGTKICQTCDGAIRKVRNPITKYLRSRDGCTTLVMCDGRRIVKTPEGLTYEYQPKIEQEFCN